MERLIVMSAGAARAVVSRLVSTLSSELEVVASYGAVQPLERRIRAGEPTDVIILTDKLMRGLVDAGFVAASSETCLGSVPTALATANGGPVRAGDITTIAGLREVLLSASHIICPDPSAASAGHAFKLAIEQLGIEEELSAKLSFQPSGFDTLRQLKSIRSTSALAVTQLTEIIGDEGVSWLGNLPSALQTQTIYAAAVCESTDCKPRAREFVRRLTCDPAALQLAGFNR